MKLRYKRGECTRLTRIQVIDTEIASKGICYLICTKQDAADFEATLASVVGMVKQRGATRLLLCFRGLPEAAIGGKAASEVSRCKSQNCEKRAEQGTAERTETWIGGYRFRHFSDTYVLYKQLPLTPELQYKLMRIKPLRESTAELFCAIYNEAFFQVPHASSLTVGQTTELLHDPQREAGYFMVGGMPVGVYILKDCGKMKAEICAICILPDLRGQGYGKHALELLESELGKRGTREVELTSADINQPAHTLYLESGYRVSKHMDKWYEVIG